MMPSNSVANPLYSAAGLEHRGPRCPNSSPHLGLVVGIVAGVIGLAVLGAWARDVEPVMDPTRYERTRVSTADDGADPLPPRPLAFSARRDLATRVQHRGKRTSLQRPSLPGRLPEQRAQGSEVLADDGHELHHTASYSVTGPPLSPLYPQNGVTLWDRIRVSTQRDRRAFLMGTAIQVHAPATAATPGPRMRSDVDPQQYVAQMTILQHRQGFPLPGDVARQQSPIVAAMPDAPCHSVVSC